MMKSRAPRVRIRQMLGQSTILILGYAAAQACALLRNVILGHMLAKGDFGIAAALTLTLQTFETITDLAADRMIVQAEDGDDPKLLAAAHTLLVARGIIIGAIIFWSAPFAAQLFGLAEQAPLFAALSAVPIIKSIMHLDSRLKQRHLDNRPMMLLEVAPQFMALLVTFPLVFYRQSFDVVVILGILQALVTVWLSHVLADAHYRLGFDRAVLKRYMIFGWPILLSAFPVLAVYQGDRMIVGSFLGVEPLAGYTAAFLIAMVPGALAARAGLSLMLPLLAKVKSDAALFAQRFQMISELMVLVAAAYLVGMAIAGGPVVALAFGKAYQGQGLITAALALMWSVRMIQTPSGALLMALGDTRPLLIAGLARAAALVLTLGFAWFGADLVMLAVSGAIGELLSLAYVGWRLGRISPRYGAIVFSRTLFLVAAAVLVGLAMEGQEVNMPVRVALPISIAAALTVAMAGVCVLPSLRALVLGALKRRRPAVKVERAATVSPAAHA